MSAVAFDDAMEEFLQLLKELAFQTGLPLAHAYVPTQDALEPL